MPIGSPTQNRALIHWIDKWYLMIMRMILVIMVLILSCEITCLLYALLKQDVDEVKHSTVNAVCSRKLEPEDLFLHYYQNFPLERYTGLRPFTLVSPQRHVVATANCNIILVNCHNITIGNVVIPRLDTEACHNCDKSDYLSIVKVLLFGEPEGGLKPIAPNGALIFEDDVLMCDHALLMLDKCYTEQINCMFGHGMAMNYFAGSQTLQPRPEQNHFKRFSTVEQLSRWDESTHVASLTSFSNPQTPNN